MPAEEKGRGASRKTQRIAPYAKTHYFIIDSHFGSKLHNLHVSM